MSVPNYVKLIDWLKKNENYNYEILQIRISYVNTKGQQNLKIQTFFKKSYKWHKAYYMHLSHKDMTAIILSIYN